MDILSKRRTFAIISHPDAGKTTITEKLLLLGGVVQLAGTVKARKASRHATSDWMRLEQERGISVTTSVMRFQYEGYHINLLDTPGHNDFSEDTYRTLTAVDSALMLIDSAKGVEDQTVKLMEVCRMSGIPIVTFMNKLDRDGLDPLELLDNVEKVLHLDCCPITWPVGMGQSFQGVYHLFEHRFYRYDLSQTAAQGEVIQLDGLADPKLDEIVGEKQAVELRDEIELIMGAGVAFDQAKFLNGELTPVFFGCALNGFGVTQMFKRFLQDTPPPLARKTLERTVFPDEDKFSGFIFKIQANMDPNHRDRIAFMRVCSGTFERGMWAYHSRLKRQVKFSNPIFMVAKERELVETAYPGDIVGIHDHGTIEIGDTFTQGEVLHFTGVPSFAPEIFRKVRLRNPLKLKNLKKGLHQLAQEGAVQLFTPLDSTDMIVGVVGSLQLDVLLARLQNEYDVEGVFDPVQLYTARWYACEDEDELHRFESNMRRSVARDLKERPVFLAESNWRLNYTMEQHPHIQFFMTSDGVNLDSAA